MTDTEGFKSHMKVLALRCNHILQKEANFIRIHIFVFAVAPLIASAIFWRSNGKYYVPYIDCLFVCFSAMTVTGLSTVNLSPLTGFQQSILFVLMWMGDVVNSLHFPPIPMLNPALHATIDCSCVGRGVGAQVVLPSQMRKHPTE